MIVHEYGHAVQDDQVPGFGCTLEAGSIGEAFGDYLAVTVSTAVTGNTFEQPCVADWDSTSYTTGPSTACGGSTRPSTTPRTCAARSTPTASCGPGRCGRRRGPSATRSRPT